MGIIRDIWGNPRGGQTDGIKDAPAPYETDVHVDGNVTIKYIRFYNRGDKPCAIWKKTFVKNDQGVETSMKHEYTYAPWDKRQEAIYIPINAVWEDGASDTAVWTANPAGEEFTDTPPTREEANQEWTDVIGSDNYQEWTAD